MRLFCLLALVLIVCEARRQDCKDDIPRCPRIYCRFYARIRHSCRKTCGGCKTISSPNALLNQWSACSRTCGGGTRLRVRRCRRSRNACPHQYQDCNTQACPKKECKGSEVYRYNSTSSCCKMRASQSECGTVASVGARVIGGTQGLQKNWPWMIRLNRTINERQTAVCGAVLLNKRWALTAGHCVSSYKLSQLKAYLAYGTALQKRVQIESIKLHSNFRLYSYDIALLKFSKPVINNQYVRPICLPNGEVSKEDTKCVIAGWGAIRNNPQKASQILQQGNLRILPFGVCKNAYRFQPFADQISSKHHVCAGTLTGKVDSCFGDSGGPLMCQRCSLCNWYVAGIVSVGPLQCGFPKNPGLYTNVLTVEKWIESQTGISQKQAFSCR